MSRQKRKGKPPNPHDLLGNEQRSGEKGDMDLFEKDDDGLLKRPFEVIIQSIIEYHASFPCPYQTRNFMIRSGPAQPIPSDNNQTERDYATIQGVREFGLAHPDSDVVLVGPDMQARFRRLAIDLEHMYIKIDTRFFRYHRVSARYMTYSSFVRLASTALLMRVYNIIQECQVIPKCWPRNSDCYNFIERRLHDRVQHLATTQIKMYTEVLWIYGAESWIRQTRMQQFEGLQHLWHANSMPTAFVLNTVVNEVVNFNWMFRDQEDGGNVEFQLFCEGKFILSCFLLFPIFLDDDSDNHDDNRWIEDAARHYRTVPSHPFMKRFTEKPGKMADIPIEEWVADVRASKLYSLDKKFIFTERAKMLNRNNKKDGHFHYCPRYGRPVPSTQRNPKPAEPESQAQVQEMQQLKEAQVAAGKHLQKVFGSVEEALVVTLGMRARR